MTTACRAHACGPVTADGTGSLQAGDTYRIPHNRGDPEPPPVLSQPQVAVDEAKVRGGTVEL